MPTAASIAARLLETDIPPDDDPALGGRVLMTDSTPARLAKLLSKELYTRGWQNIDVYEEEAGNFIFNGDYLGAMGKPWSPLLCAEIMRQFNAACRRASIQLIRKARLDDNVYRLCGCDPADIFDEDPGHWEITIKFQFEPAPTFWSKLSNAVSWKKPFERY